MKKSNSPDLIDLLSSFILVIVVVVLFAAVYGCSRPPAIEGPVASQQPELPAVLDSLANIYPGIREVLAEQGIHTIPQEKAQTKAGKLLASTIGARKVKIKPVYNITIKDKSEVDNSVTDKSVIKEKNETLTKSKPKSKEIVKTKVTPAAPPGKMRWLLVGNLIGAVLVLLYVNRERLKLWYLKVISFIFTKSA